MTSEPDPMTTSDAPPVDRRKTILMRFALVVAIVAAAWAGWYLLFERSLVSTDNAYVGADSAIITPRLAAAVIEVRVSDTQAVKAGDILIRLDDADARAEVAAAEAALRQARQRYQQAQANDSSLGARVTGATAEIGQARGALAATEAELRRANDAVARRDGMVASGAVAGEELAQARAAAATASAQVASARSALAAAEAGRAAASGNAQANAVITRVGSIDADPDVVAAQARLDTARLMLERTVIRAPMAGVVSQRQVQVGQQVAPGTPLMRIVPLGQVYVDANFRETQLKNVRTGQPARLTSDLFGSGVVFRGTVIGTGAASGAATALIPAQNATGNWVKVVQRIPVRIALDPAELARHPLPIGASMDAEIDTRTEAMTSDSQTADANSSSAPQPLKGLALFLAAFALALCNFTVVLDITIANVSVSHISGGLAVSPSQGLWVLTSYAVAEAITVPLTGWLATRFGTVRMLIACVAGFGASSFLCGISSSIEMLVIARVLQGLSGGPIMPLTQTMLTRIFPPEKHSMAMGLWATTTIAAPIFGPILGGWISDNWSWHWIFFINLPVIGFCLFTFLRSLGRYETVTARAPLDRIGLILLIVWVSAFQIMLETGREHDWFNSDTVVVMAIIAALGFVSFVIWEWYEPDPVVNIRLLRDRTLAVSTLAISLGFGAFFASVVLVPLWMQQVLGYTATNAGLVTGFQGVLAILVAPLAAGLLNRVDVRLTVSLGILWLGLTTLLRLSWNTDSTFWMLAIPQLLQGIGMPFFFVGLTALSIAAVRPDQVASAAGIVTFSRTMAGAMATALASTLWTDNGRVQRAEMVQTLNDAGNAATAMERGGLTSGQSYSALERMVESQALTGSALHVFTLTFVLFVVAALSIWLAPRPARALDPGGGH